MKREIEYRKLSSELRSDGKKTFKWVLCEVQ